MTTFSAAERRQYARQGVALPDGSYPIRNATDVQHAVDDWHRTGKSAQVKAHIIKRARAVNASLPPDWDAQDATLQSADTTLQGTFSNQWDGLRPDGFQMLQSADGETRYFPYVLQDGIGVPSTADSASQTKIGETNPQQPKLKNCPGCQAAPPSGAKYCPSCGQHLPTQEQVTQSSVVLQMDHARQIVTGVIQTPNVPVVPSTMPDTELIYPHETVAQMAHDFMRGMQLGAIGVQHNELQNGKIVPPQGEYATFVESWTAPCDLTVNGRFVVQGTWIGSVHITDPATWERVANGELAAFSLASDDVDFEDLPAEVS